MKKIILVFCVAAAMGLVLTACKGSDSSSVSPTAGSQINDPAVSGTPNAVLDIQQVYESVAAAAGLDATIALDENDLNAGGGIAIDSIVAMAAGQSRVGGDSGLVIVLEVAPGSVDEMITALEGYRDGFLNGPAYDEFADSLEATRQARIVSNGNYIIYAVASVDAGASFEDIDTAINTAFSA